MIRFHIVRNLSLNTVKFAFIEISKNNHVVITLLFIDVLNIHLFHFEIIEEESCIRFLVAFDFNFISTKMYMYKECKISHKELCMGGMMKSNDSGPAEDYSALQQYHHSKVS